MGLIDETVTFYNNEANVAEDQIKLLKRQILQLQQSIKNKTVDSSLNPELQKLITENTKLKHRLTILKRVSLRPSREPPSSPRFRRFPT
jgi:hypothetical protein